MLHVLLTLILLASWPGQAARGATPGTPPVPASPQNRAPLTVSYIDVGPLHVGGSAATVNAASYFSDPDNDKLTYSVNSPSPAIATVSISGSTVTVTPVAVGMTGKIVVTARDPGGLTATQDFNVTVQNPPPLPKNRAPKAVGSVSDVTLKVGGSSATRSVSGKFSDPDGDTLTYSVSSPNPSIVTVSISGNTVTVAPVAAGTSGKIIVTARDPGGLTATQDFTATVQSPPPPPNKAPQTQGSIGDQTLNKGGNVRTINVSSYFTDPNGDTLTYLVNSPSPAIVTTSISGSTLTLTSVAVGNSARVIVTARDPGGLTVTQDFTVAVINRRPTTVGSISNKTLNKGEAKAIVIASSFFTDPDGDTLTYTASSSKTSVATVSVSGSTVSVTPKAAGTTTITVTATDTGSLSASQTFNVTVVNRKPTTLGSISAKTLHKVGTTTTVTASSYFTDPDGDTLTYTASSSKTSVATVSQSSGTLTVTAQAAGTATITVTASDPGNLSATQTFSVTVTTSPTPTPTPPTPTPTPTKNQSPETKGSIPRQPLARNGVSITVNAASRFSDPDGDTISYAAVSSDTSVATASISGSIVTLAPVANGTATITVTATDPGKLFATQTFTATVSHRPEKAGTIPTLDMAANVNTRQVNVSSYFSDADKDTLVYTASTSEPSPATVSVSGETVTVRRVSAGIGRVFVKATDPGGLSAIQTIAINLANRTPVVGKKIPNQTLHVTDAFKTVSLDSRFTDPDGKAFAFTAESSNTSVATVTAAGTTLTIRPVAYGSTTVTVRATDHGGLYVEQTLTATVENRAPEPVGTGIGLQSLYMSNGARTIDVAPYFSDPDGDRLTYSSSWADSAIVGVSTLGSVVTLTPKKPGNTGKINVTATDPKKATGSQDFNVTVKAGSAPPDTSTNRQPVAVNPIVPDTLYQYGPATTIDLAPVFSDSGDVLTYTAYCPDPDKALVSVSGSNLKITPKGPGTTGKSTVTAMDRGGLTATQDFNITVKAGNPPKPPNSPPVTTTPITPDTLYRSGPAGTIDLTKHFRDPDGDTLTYAAILTDTTVVTVNVSGSTLTITPTGVGTTGKIAVTATDPDSAQATHDFQVTVLAGSSPVKVNRSPRKSTSVDHDLYVTIGGGTKTFSAVPYFTDPDGDVLTYRLLDAPGSGRATVTLAGSTLSVEPLALGSTGKHRLRATDPGGLFAEQDLTFHVVGNLAPVTPKTLSAQTLTLCDGPEAFKLSLYFSDPDNEKLTYEVSSSNGTAATASESGGTLTVTPKKKGLTTTVTVTASDTGELSVSQSFLITVGNSAPKIARNIPPQTLTLSAGFVRFNLATYFRECDGDTLTYAVSSSNGTAATASESGGTLTVTPKKKGLTTTVTVTATDTEKLSANQSFIVTVGNSAPNTFGTMPDRALPLSAGLLKFDLTTYFTDADGDTLEYSTTSPKAAVATVRASDDSLYITPVAAGTIDSVTVTATDSGNLSAVQRFTVTVTGAVNQCPVTTGAIPKAKLAVGGDSLTVAVAGFFTDGDGDALTYTVDDPDTMVARVTIAGSTVTIRPVAAGKIGSVTVAASDGTCSATQTFGVEVSDSQTGTQTDPKSGPWSVSGGNVYLLVGNVGVGTSQPEQRLVVDGSVTAEAVRVDSVSSADYVFEPDYPLMPLEELERFLQTNRHLPGIATAEQMAASGLRAGEMQTGLLAKIEELTLYVIAQHERIASQQRLIDLHRRRLMVRQKRVEALERQLESLEQSR